MGEAEQGSRMPLLVAVPLYRSPELVAPLAAALLAMADELRTLDATLLLIDDSPDDAALRAELDRLLPTLVDGIRVELVRNPANLGFVRTANLALARGRDAGHDVLLLNSDALPRPGAFAEMVAVAALDPLIAVVSPRSDNATICNSPDLEEHRSAGRDQAYAAHRAIERHLPRISYVPTAVGFCLLVRHAVLREFGLFDEIYGGGYNEENDFIRRCNRRGYRAVLANHAYVHHLGGASFARSAAPTSAREEANRAILIARYPEYPAIVERWFDGAEYRAQRLLSGLVPDADGRLRLLFDCGTLRKHYNGTFEHICALLAAFAARHAARYDIAILCEAEAFAFHGLDRVAGLRRVDDREARARPAAAAMRLSQPFAPEDILPLRDYAPLNAVLMLDTIAMDCQQLDNVGLEGLWATMADDVDAIGFNSAFSRDQFARRFEAPGRVVEFVSRCSTDLADYRTGMADADAGGGGAGVLLVGNHYPHKHVRETLAALRAAAPDLPVAVLGVAVDAEPGVTSHTAGDLPQETVDTLYHNADIVLFPSHYEGFGLPIVQALARRCPVIARDLPSAREIRALCGAGENLHLAGSTAEMVALAAQPPRWRDLPPSDRAPEGWGVAADALAEALATALDRFDYAVCRRRQDRAVALREAVRIAGAVQWVLPSVAIERDDIDLPPLGLGFMLGDMIEVARPSRGSTLDRWLGGWRRPAGVKIAAALDDHGADAVAEMLFERLRDEPEGMPVTLSLDTADPAAVRVVAATLLLACGCAVSAVEPRPGGLVARGVYRHRWTGVLPGPEDDAAFVRYVYRHALGRSPDAAGGGNYLAELGDGLARETMLQLFLSSDERRRAIAAQMKRRGIEV